MPSSAAILHFNPRARMGARREVKDHETQVEHISIHAPAWGRDDLYASPSAASCNFNPRARMGARHVAETAFAIHIDFNPRARMGARRKCGAVTVCLCQISIHAPAWGRDVRPVLMSTSSLKFQSTRPHGGATNTAGWSLGCLYHFNPRARMGARRLRVSMLIRPCPISIHAPAWGRD